MAYLYNLQLKNNFSNITRVDDSLMPVIMSRYKDWHFVTDALETQQESVSPEHTKSGNCTTELPV